MKKILIAVTAILALSFTATAWSAGKPTPAKAEGPTPFGLVFGTTNKDAALDLLKKAGGSVTQSGTRVIKDDITNPHIEGAFLKGVGIDGVVSTKVWFLDGVLMEMTYVLSGSFQPFFDQLSAKYGKPTKARTAFGGEAHALWVFKDVEVSLDRPFMGNMTLDYTSPRLFREAKALDNKVYAEATKTMGQKQKGF